MAVHLQGTDTSFHKKMQVFGHIVMRVLTFWKSLLAHS